MSAKHKAATDVTIASTQDESVLHELVQRYWRLVAGLAVAFIVLAVFVENRREAARSAMGESWRRLGQDVQGLAVGRVTPPSANVLGDVSEELKDTAAGPWAKVLEIGRHLEDEDLPAARRAAQELATTWPDHPLAAATLYPDGSSATTLRSRIEKASTALEAWEAAHPELFENPPLPEGSPRVRLTTSAGPIVLGLYRDRAPEHVENFLKLSGEGFYDGVLFHRVTGNVIQGGDPNSRDAENPDSWGQGGPGYTVDLAESGLWHFTGALSAASTSAGGPSSGSQFFIVTEEAHQYDGDYCVFGVVVEGMDTVRTIASGAVLGDRPVEPVVIESTEVL